MLTSFREIFELDLELTVIDVGAASMGDGTDPYAILSRDPSTRVVGFEPNAEACARRNAAAGAGHRFFPFFVGDGRRRQFHLCRNPLTSSLYRPNERLLDLFQNFSLPVVSVEEVETVRLDDIAEIADCDFLKLDVQGAELDVLAGAAEVLGKAMIVHAEVEFIPIYEGQPLFGDVDVALRQAGFWLHRFVEPFSRQFKPLIFNNDPFAPGSQLIYAEAAVYVPALTSLDGLPADKLMRLAWLLHDVYGSVDLAAVVLDAFDRQTGAGAQAAYLAALTGRPRDRRAAPLRARG